MRVLATYQSKSGGVDHEVREDDFGNLSCTCIAAQHDKVCWAMRKEQGKKDIERLKDIQFKLLGRSLPDKQQLIREQWEYIGQSTREMKQKYEKTRQV